MIETVPCNLCGSSASELVFSKWNFNIVKCSRCGLCYVNPRQFTVEADDYFRGAYLSTIEENGVTRPGIAHLYREVLDRLSTYLTPGTLLDVGCAMGHFLRDARERGWEATGTECSQYAAAYGREKHGLDIHTACDLRDAGLPEAHFDAAVAIEVVEHLPDPRQTLAEMFRVMKPSGVIYLTTPNFASFRALLQREDWAAVIPTGHLYHFTAETLSEMLRAVGFTSAIDLTGPARFEEDLQESAKAQTLRSTAEESEQLRESTAREDDSKLSNGRGEGLVILALKPAEGSAIETAARRARNPRRELEGRLVASPGATAEESKVFYVHEGLKHWVTSIAWLEQRGMRIEDTIQIEREDLNSLLTGPALI